MEKHLGCKNLASIRRELEDETEKTICLFLTFIVLSLIFALILFFSIT